MEAPEEELRQVVNQISHLKAPGLDGTHAIFDKKCWPLVGKNILYDSCFYLMVTPLRIKIEVIFL